MMSSVPNRCDGSAEVSHCTRKEKWLVVVEGGGGRMEEGGWIEFYGVTGDSVVTVTPIPRLANHSVKLERAKGSTTNGNL